MRRSSSFQPSCFSDKDWEPIQYSEKCRSRRTSKERQEEVLQAITKACSKELPEGLPRGLKTTSALPSISAINTDPEKSSEKKGRPRRHSHMSSPAVGLSSIPMARTSKMSLPRLSSEIPSAPSMPRKKKAESVMQISALKQTNEETSENQGKQSRRVSWSDDPTYSLSSFSQESFLIVEDMLKGISHSSNEKSYLIIKSTKLLIGEQDQVDTNGLMRRLNGNVGGVTISSVSRRQVKSKTSLGKQLSNWFLSSME
jgi:hypothetical protein